MATDKITIVIDADASKAIQDFIRLNKEQKKQDGLLDGLKGKWAALGAAVGALAGAFKLVEFTKSFAQFRQASDATSKQFGKSSDEIIKKLKEVSAGTIANNDLIVAANKSLALNVTKDVGQIAKLLEIARVRGRALGVDTTQAFEDIVTGIGRNSPLILDNLGIITKGWAEQAAAAGVAYDTTFILNKVLEDGNNILAKTGPLTVSAAERFQQLSAGFKNATLALGEALLPVFETLLPVITSMVNGFSSLTKSVSGLNSESKKESQILSKNRSELNARIEILKDSNISEELRERITKNVNEQLRQLNLKQIDAKTSILELNKVQQKSNEIFLEKIRIAAAQELIAEQENKAAKLQKKNLEDLKRVEELRIEAQGSGRDAKAASTAAKNLQNTISLREEEIKLINEEIEAIIKRNNIVEKPVPQPPRQPSTSDQQPITNEEMFTEVDDDFSGLQSDYESELKARKDFTVDLANQMKDDLFGIYSDIANRRIDELDREQDAIRDKIANGVLTEEEGQKQLDALRKKEKAERKKLAKAQKAQTLSEIAMKTANGIMGIWEKWGSIPPVAASLTALLSGIGIAQSAMVASQPLPQFAQGTNDAPGGLSLVGEQGAELVNIPENGQVITNDILRAMASNGAGSGGNVYNIKVETNDPQQFVNRLQRQYGIRIFGAT